MYCFAAIVFMFAVLRYKNNNYKIYKRTKVSCKEDCKNKAEGAFSASGFRW